MTTLTDLLTAFLDHERDRNYSPCTLRNHRAILVASDEHGSLVIGPTSCTVTGAPAYGDAIKMAEIYCDDLAS